MKLLASLFILVFIVGCSSEPQREKTDASKPEMKEEIISEKADSKNDEAKSEGQADPVTFQTSTYDDPEFSDRVSEHQVSLKALSDKGVFAAIHAKLFQKLGQKHQVYFQSKGDYELLAWAKGNLFREKKTDGGFIVYDKKNQRISILVYREKSNTYAELFRELKVENGLENADCNYSSFGSIDYIIAEEIIYQEESLVKNPESYLEYSAIKITDIAKDKDFLLKKGCFSKSAAVDKKETANSLGIATGYVYNDWEALRYNEANNSFIIFFGQAFAD
jgi:hypothetical protein